MITRDAIGRFTAGPRDDQGTEVLTDTYSADTEIDGPEEGAGPVTGWTEAEQLALYKVAALTAGVAGCSTEDAIDTIQRFRDEYLAVPEAARPVTPQDFAGGFRGRNPDTRTAPQDPGTVWAHFRAVHDPQRSRRPTG